jgi:uncharacterized protein with PIN domain
MSDIDDLMSKISYWDENEYGQRQQYVSTDAAKKLITALRAALARVTAERDDAVEALMPFGRVRVHSDAKDKANVSATVQWADGRHLVLSLDGLKVRYFRRAHEVYSRLTARAEGGKE